MKPRDLILAAALLFPIATAAGESSPGPIDLRAIPSGSSIRVEYRSDGCFHGEGWLIQIESDPPVSAQVQLLDHSPKTPDYKPVTLEARHLARLANLLEYYRSERRGSCTTHEQIDITYKRGDGTEFTESFLDDTCGAGSQPNVLELWTLVRWSEGIADPDAPKEGGSLGTAREILERVDK